MTHSREAVQGKERGLQLWVLTGLIGRSVMVDHNELWWGYVWSSTQVKITIWANAVWLDYPQLWSNNDGWCVLTFFCVWKSLLWHFQHFVGGSWLTGNHSDSMTNKKFNSKLHAHKNIFLDFWLDEFISNSGSNPSDPSVGCQFFLNQLSFSQNLSIKCPV